MATTVGALSGQGPDLEGRGLRPVFFEVTDISADSYRKEVVDLASLLQEDGLREDLRAVYREGIEEAIENLNATLRDEVRAITITFPRILSKLPYSRLDQVVKDHGLADGDGEQQVVYLPAEKVTGHQALAGPIRPDYYEPHLNLCIQTSADTPRQLPTGPGESIEVPSDGTWHKFPLGMIEIATIL